MTVMMMMMISTSPASLVVSMTPVIVARRATQVDLDHDDETPTVSQQLASNFASCVRPKRGSCGSCVWPCWYALAMACALRRLLKSHLSPFHKKYVIGTCDAQEHDMKVRYCILTTPVAVTTPRPWDKGSADGRFPLAAKRNASLS